MNYITRKCFFDLAVCRSEQIDFVAMCITPWHMLGLRAFVEQLCSTIEDVRGLLLIRKHSSGKSRNYYISEEDIHFPSNANVEVFYEDRSITTNSQKLKNLSNLLVGSYDERRTKHKVYILQTFYMPYQFAFTFLQQSKCNCELVCIDEGFGSYRNRCDLRHYYFSKGWKKGISAMFSWGLNSIISHKINKTKTWWTILKKNNGEWVKNEDVCYWYNKVLYEKKDIKFEEAKYILILTQPYYEVKEDRESMDVINAAFDAQAEKYRQLGYNIYVKPHPREHSSAIEAYCSKGYKIFPYRGALESILGRIDNLPECVIGTNTTALVTAKVLFGVRAYSVVKTIEKDVTKGSAKTNRFFYNYFKEIVEF